MAEQFTSDFNRLAAAYSRWKTLFPTVMSNIAMNHFIGNFARQGSYNERGMFIPWRRTKSKGNTFGRKSSGILIGRGRLRRGFEPRPLPGEARVINSIPYAAAHNEGVNEVVTVSAHTRRRFGSRKEGTGKFSAKTRKERMRTVKFEASKGKVKSHSRKMNLAARPFMRTNPQLLDEIEREAFKDLERMFMRA